MKLCGGGGEVSVYMDWAWTRQPECRLAMRITAILAAAWLAHLIAGRRVSRLRLMATTHASGVENAK